MATTNKRKKAVAATVAAAALLLGGTFAWTSISQQATNEAIVDINPGGRLHDDFNGSNKDVYVENFNSADDPQAVSIFARVKLTEYMEIGQEAGIKIEAASDSKKAEPLGPGVYGDQTDWQTYLPSEDSLKNDANVSNTHWELSWGNENHNPVYMQTFNRNKDSKEADRNGTYEGLSEGDIVHYDDYQTYTAGQTLDGEVTYDHDDDTIDEVVAGTAKAAPTKDTPYDDDTYDIYVGTETNTAKELTYNARVITMQQWIDEGKPTGPFWVYDIDGWAYWAQEIKPGETTGLLLDAINMKKVPDDNWYYGINVVGEFVSAADLNAFGTESQPPSGNAAELLAKAAGETAKMSIVGPSAIPFGKTGDYTATLKMAGVDLETGLNELTFEIENIQYSDDTLSDRGDEITINDGTVTVGAGVGPGTTFVVKAKGTLDDGTEITAAKTVKVSEGELTYEMNEDLLVVIPAISTTSEQSSFNLSDSQKEAQFAVYDSDGNQLPVSKWEIKVAGSTGDVTLGDSSISETGLLTFANNCNSRGVTITAYISQGAYRGTMTEQYITIIYPTLLYDMETSGLSDGNLLPGQTGTVTLRGYSQEEVDWKLTASDAMMSTDTYTTEEGSNANGDATVTITHTCVDEASCACAFSITVTARLVENEYRTGFRSVRLYKSELIDTMHMTISGSNTVYTNNENGEPHQLTLDGNKGWYSFNLGEIAWSEVDWTITDVEGDLGNTKASSSTLTIDNSESARPTAFRLEACYDNARCSETTRMIFNVTVTYE